MQWNMTCGQHYQSPAPNLSLRFKSVKHLKDHEHHRKAHARQHISRVAVSAWQQVQERNTAGGAGSGSTPAEAGRPFDPPSIEPSVDPGHLSTLLPVSIPRPSEYVITSRKCASCSMQLQQWVPRFKHCCLCTVTRAGFRLQPNLLTCSRQADCVPVRST